MLKPPTEKISAETREKLLALAEFIETDQDHAFHMGMWWTTNGDGLTDTTDPDHAHCGTAGCIAGFTLLQHNIPEPLTLNGYPVRAAEALGLSREHCDALFMPPISVTETATRAKAVRVLRNFAYTGDVDWSV